MAHRALLMTCSMPMSWHASRFKGPSHPLHLYPVSKERRCTKIKGVSIQTVEDRIFFALAPLFWFLTTNCLICSKYVSQKRNEAIDNGQWYNMLLNFKFVILGHGILD